MVDAKIGLIRQRHEFSTVKGPVLTDLGTYGKIFVGFTDIREAKGAAEKVKHIYPEWRLHALTAKEFAQKFEPGRSASASNFEGQIFASVFYNGRHPSADGRVISHSFKDLLETFGDVKAFNSLPAGQNNVIDFLAEFFDTRAADNVVATLNGSSVDASLPFFTIHTKSSC